MSDADDDQTPTPGYTAWLDQLGARARDLPDGVRARIEEAAARVREAPSTETVGALMAELRAAGLG
ncbi:hypothetical protein ACFC26_09775 [Kitasatospora purpeofusca]|uniref:hypothetical protein n=1 Tax=Kitasatospora purpeofusca TaxID=67352 RepID=UPI0035D75607